MSESECVSYSQYECAKRSINVQSQMLNVHVRMCTLCTCQVGEECALH